MASKISSALGGGLLGAIALTLLHAGSNKLVKSHAATSSLGVNALSRILKGFAESARPVKKETFELTPAGEILSNALYFSIAGAGSKRNLMLRAALLGLTAGLGALVLPRYLGLDEQRDTKSKLLTVSRYLAGSLLTAAAIRSMEKAKKAVDKATDNLVDTVAEKQQNVGRLLREHHTIVGN